MLRDVLVGLDRFGHVSQRDFQNLSQPEGQIDDLSIAVRQTDLAPDDVTSSAQRSVLV